MKPVPRRTDTVLPIDEAMSSVSGVLDDIWINFAGLEGRTPGTANILFVSPRHGVGTTTMASCVAIGLARNLSEPVALVELNIYSPGMAAYLDLPVAPGITDVLDGRAQPAEAVRNSKVSGLHVLSAGTPRKARKGELLSAPANDLMELATRDKRYTIIDAPPVVEYPQLRPLLERADGVVLVLRARSTKKREAVAAVRAIDDFGIPILGSILNRFRSDLPFGIRG